MNERVQVQVPVGWLIAFGAIWTTALGAIVFLVSRRPVQLAGWQPSNFFSGPAPNLAPNPMLNSTVNPNAQPVMLTPPSQTAPTKLATYTLLVDRASRVMTAASDNYWRVELRTINPPGGIARIATDPNSLMFPSASTAIPAGDSAEIRVRPGDALFAIGNIPGVELSISATEVAS